MGIEIVEVHAASGLCKIRVDGVLRLMPLAKAQRLCVPAETPPQPHTAPNTPPPIPWVPPALCTPREAATALGVSSRKLPSLLQPIVTPLGTRRYLLDQVEQLAQVRVAGGTWSA